MKKYICTIVSIVFLSALGAQNTTGNQNVKTLQTQMTQRIFGSQSSDTSGNQSSDTMNKTSTGTSGNQTANISNKTSGMNFVPNAQMAMSSSDYLVTAGDIYTLAFAVNSTPVTYTISVDSSYKIRVANITMLDASGKTFLQLKRLVEQIVTENYHLSGVQFILTSPAVFNVEIMGEVQETQTKPAWALSRLSSLLEEMETPYSSERNVTITSESGVKKSYDLFKAARRGDLSQDPYVRPGDTVTVNRITRKVTITGSVERPGTYELLDGENLRQLIAYYGNGLQELADTSRIELTRLIDENEKPGKKIYLAQKSIDDNYPLVCYDSVFISSYTELQPVMFMDGALYLQSETMTGSEKGIAPESSAHVAVSFQSGENYAFLIRRNSTMFSSVSDIENAFIIRKGQDIPIDVSRILYDASYYSPEFVQPYDTLMIPFKQAFVSVAGAVNTPGRYPYIPGRTWDYYIGLAGGFVVDKNNNQTITIKDIKGNILQKSDPITPETTITAATNSFTYYFSKYSPVITTFLSLISVTATLIAVTQ